MNEIKTINVQLQLKKCDKCNGTGKVESCEYTPPFEKFMADCPKCKGTCYVIIGANQT